MSVPARILVVDDTPANIKLLLQDRVEAESIGELTLRGLHRPVSSYNVLALR